MEEKINQLKFDMEKQRYCPLVHERRCFSGCKWWNSHYKECIKVTDSKSLENIARCLMELLENDNERIKINGI